ERLHATLEAVAVAGRRHRPQDPRLSGRTDWMVLNGAYLVDKSREEEFAAALAPFRQEGIEVELTGPWGALLVRGGARMTADSRRGAALAAQGRLPPERVALVDLLDRLLSGGVVITGDLVLSIADIDLVRISLRALIASVR